MHLYRVPGSQREKVVLLLGEQPRPDRGPLPRGDARTQEPTIAGERPSSIGKLPLNRGVNLGVQELGRGSVVRRATFFSRTPTMERRGT